MTCKEFLSSKLTPCFISSIFAMPTALDRRVSYCFSSVIFKERRDFEVVGGAVSTCCGSSC